MEEGRLIAFAVQTVGNARHIIHAIGRKEERLHEHGYGGENGWHAIDRLATVTVAIAIGQRTMGYQRVGERRIALELPVV